MVSCLAGGDGLDDDWIGVLPPLCVLLEDLVGGGGGSQPSLRPPLKLNPLRLLGNGGRPCREDIAILSCMLIIRCVLTPAGLSANQLLLELPFLTTHRTEMTGLLRMQPLHDAVYVETM